MNFPEKKCKLVHANAEELKSLSDGSYDLYVSNYTLHLV